MATLKSIKNKYLTVSDGTVLGVTTNTENISALSFKLATADSLSKFNLVDGFSDDYNDATGVDASASTDEIRSSSNFYSGSQTGAVLNAYTSGSGNWTCPAGITSVEVVVVAAGGGGGGLGGGGGAGGVVHDAVRTVVPTQNYAYTVGTGGAGNIYNAGTAGDGGNSTFDSMDAEGGGGSSGSSSTGRAGGSGGGGNGGYASAGGVSDQPASSGGGTGYGNAGGAGVGGNYYGGGGGGAGAIGEAGSTGGGGYGGDGGIGKLFVGFEAYGTTSANVASSGSNGGYFGGGGGAESDAIGTVGVGGAGGGANGTTDSIAGVNALANTGGGGGGARWGTGGTGGSGIVMIKEVDAYNDMTIASNAFTSQAADPTTARIIIDEESYTGETTLNTDLKAYVSRDGFATAGTQIQLADQGLLNFGAGIDTYTKLMLHCDGTNGGTTFTDSSGSAHTVTAQGSTHTDTTIKKFGTASAQFGGDGTGDDLVIPDSADWDIGTGDFTFDTWIYPTDNGSSYRKIFASGGWGGTTTEFDWVWDKTDAEKLRFIMYDGTNLPTTTSTATIANDVWTHVAVVRSGSTITQYINGTADGTVSSSVNIVSHGALQVGRAVLTSSTAQMWQGYIDELRVSKGIARWTANFSPPSLAYTHNRRLLSGSVDISGQPAGSNMKYKLTTHNQAITKQTRVYGTSMAWA